MKYLSLLFVVCLAACSSSNDKMKNEIGGLLKKANDSFFQGKVNTKQIDSAYSAIDTFVKRFPDDTLSPAYLLEKALLQEKQRQYVPAIVTLERIYSAYPSSKQASKAVFLQGFLYANVLNQYDVAKQKYQLYLDKYSSVDPKMTNDVKMELENLGKTPDQILEEIQKKGRYDSVQAPS
jgi:outer membrane protein assembly factor BamD (BamD/ComL family)